MWNGHSGALIANATKKPRKRALLRGQAQREMGEVGEQERALGAAACGVDVKRDDRHQHQQPAEQAVEQELHRRVLALADTEAPDHEIHRDQHRLEEDVEEEDIGGHEDTDNHRLEHKQQREVGLHTALGAVSVVPRSEDHDRHQHDGHQDQDERDAVHTDRVMHTELRNPVVYLGELELRTVRLEAQRHHNRDRQRREREHQREPFGKKGTRIPIGRCGVVAAGGGMAAITSAPASGTAPMTVSHGKLLMPAASLASGRPRGADKRRPIGSQPHQEHGGDEERRAEEHRQCV